LGRIFCLLSGERKLAYKTANSTSPMSVQCVDFAKSAANKTTKPSTQQERPDSLGDSVSIRQKQSKARASERALMVASITNERMRHAGIRNWARLDEPSLSSNPPAGRPAGAPPHSSRAGRLGVTASAVPCRACSSCPPVRPAWRREHRQRLASFALTETTPVGDRRSAAVSRTPIFTVHRGKGIRKQKLRAMHMRLLYFFLSSNYWNFSFSPHSGTARSIFWEKSRIIACLISAYKFHFHRSTHQSCFGNVACRSSACRCRLNPIVVLSRLSWTLFLFLWTWEMR
jgi:hypothetical protein